MLKTINVKGKPYVPVNERLKYFREHYPEYGLTSEIIKVDESSALIKASITGPHGFIFAQGIAHEIADDGYINKTSHVENCETSAWGRALANFGIGIDASVASADEVIKATKVVGKKPEKQKPTKEEAMEFLTGSQSAEALNVVYKSLMKYDWGEDKDELEECKENVLEKLSSK